MSHKWPEMSTEERVSFVLISGYSPFCLLGGIGGNLLAFMVFRAKCFREKSISIYFSALAVLDTIVLTLGLGRHFMKTVTTNRYDIRHLHPWVCKSHGYLVYTSMASTSWILVATTVQTILEVFAPERGRKLAKKKSTWTIIGVIIVTIGLFHSYQFVFFGETEFKKGNKTVRANCGFTDQLSSYVYLEIRPWIANAVFVIIPFVVMLVGNLAVIKKLHEELKSKSTKKGRMRMMSVSVCIVYLMLTFPDQLNEIIYVYYKESIRRQKNGKAKEDLIDDVTDLLKYTNHAVNFYIYLATNQHFVHEINKIFCGHRKASYMANYRDPLDKLNESRMFRQHMLVNTVAGTTLSRASELKEIRFTGEDMCGSSEHTLTEIEDDLDVRQADQMGAVVMLTPMSRDTARSELNNEQTPAAHNGVVLATKKKKSKRKKSSNMPIVNNINNDNNRNAPVTVSNGCLTPG